jgi:peptidoglycan/LPS O-acetylase OafA/YrhL
LGSVHLQELIPHYGRLNVLAHIALLQNLSEAWCQSIDPPLWSVATEWQIYFFLPLLLLPVWRRYGNIVLVGIAFALGLAPHCALPRQYNFDWACPWYLGLFSLGMVAATAKVERGIWGGMPVGRIALALSVVALVATAVRPTLGNSFSGDRWDYGYRWKLDILTGLAIASFISYGARCVARRPQVAASSLWTISILESKWLVGLGAFSYSLYLVHYPILVVASILSQQLRSIWLLCSMLLFWVPLSLTVSYVFHLAFERPFLSRRM